MGAYRPSADRQQQHADFCIADAVSDLPREKSLGSACRAQFVQVDGNGRQRLLLRQMTGGLRIVAASVLLQELMPFARPS
jgi:hypothetical protein